MKKRPSFVLPIIVTIAMFIISSNAFCQMAGTVESTRGVALVIGNAVYTWTKALKNPANDAEDIGMAMQDLGWDVLSYTDASLATMKGAVREFATRLKGQRRVSSTTRGTGSRWMV